MGTDMDAIYLNMKQEYGSMLEEKDSSGDTRYTDFNDWMSQLYPSSTDGEASRVGDEP